MLSQKTERNPNSEIRAASLPLSLAFPVIFLEVCIWREPPRDGLREFGESFQNATLRERPERLRNDFCSERRNTSQSGLEVLDLFLFLKYIF